MALRQHALRAGLLACVALVPGSAEAGSGVWTSGGPYGGSTSIVVADPTNPAILYAGTHHGGVFKSTNSGASWVRSETGLGNAYVSGLAIDPSTPSRLYAGVGSGVLRSTDSGGSWTTVATFSARTLTVDPGVPQNVYAAAGNDGFFKSTDAGSTWAPINTGMPSVPNAQSLAVAPSPPGTLYACTGYGRGPVAVYKSTDAGSNWTLSYTAPFGTDWIGVIAVDPLFPARVYAAGADGVVKSTDSGATWSQSNGGLTTPYTFALVIDPAAVDTLYAGTWAGGVGTFDGGVFKSTDAGGTWNRATTDRVNPGTFGLTIQAGSPSTLWAATYAGVRRSTSGGVTWTEASNGLVNLNVNALAIDPADHDVVYAATTSYDSIGPYARPGGVFKSTDGGATWVARNAGLEYPYVTAMAIHPGDPAQVYAGTTSALFASTDAGATWSLTSLGLGYTVRGIVFDPVSSTTRYVLTPGVRKSTDAGGTWSFISPVGLEPRALVVDPVSPDTLYLASYGGFGLYKSTNGGGSWVASYSGLGTNYLLALAVDPSSPTTIYAGAANGGVYKSTDAGSTWRHTSTGLQNRSVNNIVVDPTHPATLYAATSIPAARSGGAVFRSTDAGGTWAPLRAGLPPTRAVYSLALDDSAGTKLYVGLQGGGVWQAGPPPTAFAKGDFDGDGRAELVFRSNSAGEQNKVWFMNGTARIGEAAITPSADGAEWQMRGQDDLDGNGTTDLVFRNQGTGQLQFWLMNGTSRAGSAEPLRGASAPALDWELAATADFDGDGRADLVWRNLATQKLAIWTMSGATRVGSLTPSPDQAVDGNWAVAAAVDCNNDGYVDLVWYNSTSGKVVTWYLDAQAVRRSGQFTAPSSAGDNNWRLLASADLSRGDTPGAPPPGSPDLVWRNETSGNQVVWHMDFASTRVHGEFTSPTANSTALEWTIVGPR